MFSLERALEIAHQFDLPEPIEVEDFLGKGNINLDTVLVTAGPECQLFLLQRINDDVFKKPERVMQGMIASLNSQANALVTGHPEAHDWRVPHLVPCRDGNMFYGGQGVWRLLTFLDGTQSYKSLSDVSYDERLRLAREVGRGLAIYSDLTQDIDAASVSTSLPGYRNTRLYFHQLHAALEGAREHAHVYHRLPDDEEERESAEPHFYVRVDEEERLLRRHDPELLPFIQLALRHESLATKMQELRESGVIRQIAIHGDTKLENFLFDRQTGRVVSLVDLDTIMPHSWLADWGDMVRSLCNVAGEKETDLDKIVVDAEVYAAVLEGFLQTATSATEEEIDLMPEAVQAIALELGVRFLADYLRGDTYFGLMPDDPRELNKTRAMVQLRLFEKLVEHEPEARATIAKVRGISLV